MSLQTIENKPPLTYNPVGAVLEWLTIASSGHISRPLGGCMAKGQMHNNKMAKKPKKDTSPPKEGGSVSDRPTPPITAVAPRGKLKNK
ncbi:MAG: hypothetical protein KA295_02555 [Giesbergeria sp.]|nr:hypothetical protein [Giesbergeria sp.]MBP6320579.1 hypothetical protein [Giesbergeria sp.]MBP6375202.1 hypothetical protein [Giesbergeria sp.]MBP7916015.1 hypothetical protein [Giesbergeria sp.]